MLTVYYVKWVESERGCQRIDGTSLHKDKEAMDQYIKRYRNEDFYSYIMNFGIKEVSQDVYDKVQEKGTIWEKENNL